MTMTLAAGTRLGPYTVVSPLGAGGMGEVYRATDTRLKRDVALKILPDTFARDAERLARFQREAQVLASLNHPNIGAIHGLEESGTVKALVLELVDGPTLADRLASGPMPLAEAVAVARQIADALDAAHEHGIVHRDLKPSNIKLRADGTVKVLDFGLAKAADAVSSPTVDLTQSPTLVSPAVTQAGFILGTAAYMSPEQAKGRTVDRRSDIWAFGCVLYEMLTGTRAFAGDDVTDTMAGILRGEPDWTRIPDDVPPALVRVLKRCMEKDRRRRRHDIGDVHMDIDDAMSAPTIDAPARGAGFRWSARRAIAAGAVVLATAAVAGAIGWYARPEAPAAVRRFVIPLADEQRYSNTGRRVLALSPDGSHLVYAANNRLYLRRLDQLSATEIQGTDAGSGRGPFFSPDGQWIGFWAGGQLKRIGLSGGAPIALADIGNPFGASWSADDTILFGDSRGIWRVPGGGGAPERVITVEQGEFAHGPQLLPDGEHVLFSLRKKDAANWEDSVVVAQSLRSGTRTEVLKRAREAQYVQTGHLVYTSAGTLLAIRFDPGRLATSGGAVALVQNVPDGGANSGASQFAVAANGTMAYISGDAAAQLGTLVWVDRTGSEAPTPGSVASPGLANPRISPDGRRVAMISEGDLWVQDLQGRPPIRLTFEGAHFSPVWSLDGSRIFYEGNRDIGAVAADGSGRPERVSGQGHLHPHAVAHDGNVIVARLPDDSPENADIMRLVPGQPSLQPVVVTQNLEGVNGLSLSPDGRWLAYASSATGTSEIWVQPYPGPGAAVRISPKGGREPVWAKNGRELFYLEGRRLMAVVVQPGTTFSFSPAASLFEHDYVATGQPPSYDVAGDGRFLMVKSGATATVPPIVMTLDWFEELRRRVP
jgi:serine/threonine-protein kinase